MINSNFATQISTSCSRLKEFESLEDNWDSYGAPLPDRQAIEEAQTILEQASRSVILQDATGLTCYPFPDRSGGISLYFELEDRELRLKLHPCEDKRVVYYVNKMKPEQFDYAELSYDRDRLEEHFNWLITGNR